MAILSNLKPPAGAVHCRDRVGRGPGSGKGKTCGKGQNGQRSRSGRGGRQYFEGGQMPLQRRVPKRGFRNVLADKVVNLNVGALERCDDGAEVTIEVLRGLRLVKAGFDKLKILGGGDLSKKLTVHAHGFSAGAVQKITQAGGQAVIVEPSSEAKAEKPAPGGD